MSRLFSERGRITALCCCTILVGAWAGSAHAQQLTEIPGSPFIWTSAINSNVVLLSHDEATLFVTNQISNSVSVLDVAPDGALTLLGVYPTARMPTGLALDPAQERLYVATLDGIATHGVNPDRSLTQIALAPHPPGAGVQPWNGIRYVGTGTNSAFLYVNEGALPENFVAGYRVLQGGLLDLAGIWLTGAPGSRAGYYAPARLLAFDGFRLFVGNDATVSVFDIAPDGSLALVPGSPFRSPLPPAPPFPGSPPPYAPALALDPSGGGLYAILDGSNPVRFAVLPNGSLVFEASFTVSTTYPVTNLSLHPSGRWLFGGYGASGVRGWDTRAPGAPVLAAGPGVGVWNAAGTLSFAGGGSLTQARVRVMAFTEGPPRASASCIGSVAGRAVVASHVDLCGVVVDSTNGAAGFCRPGAAGLSSCTFNGQSTLALGLGPADVTVTATAPDGATDSCISYITVVDRQVPSMTCPGPTTLECTGPSTPVSLQASCFDNCGACTAWCPPATLSLGAFWLACLAADTQGNQTSCQVVATVVDTTPPTVSVTASPAVLWPPDHRLVPITLRVHATDVCDPAPVFECVAVSNESDDSLGTGNATPDIVWDGSQFWFRAERSGLGVSRVYTITCSARDAAGNVGMAEGTVIVPHDLAQ